MPHSRGSFHSVKAISRCVLPSAAKTASPKLKKLPPERMLDSTLTGVRPRLVSFSKANASRTRRWGPSHPFRDRVFPNFIFETGL